MPQPHIYTVAKGNEVPERFHGSEVQLTRGTTIAELLSLGHFENEAAIVQAAESQWLIGARQAIRNELGREVKDGEAPPTLESASAKGNAVKLGAPRPAAQAKPKTPKAKAQAATKASGSKLFERMASDEKFRAQMFRALDNQAEFEAWQAATAEAAQA